jgi:hypothetical protein
MRRRKICFQPGEEEMKEDIIPERIAIRYTDDPMFGGPSTVVAFHGEEEETVFSFYMDELSFSKKELEGLTIREMRALKHRKDVSYLRS